MTTAEKKNKEYFFLIVTKKDDPNSNIESIKIAKAINKRIKSLNLKGQKIKVYIISYPSLKEASKIVKRIKGISILEKDD